MYQPTRKIEVNGCKAIVRDTVENMQSMYAKLVKRFGLKFSVRFEADDYVGPTMTSSEFLKTF